MVTGVENTRSELANQFSLLQNYPIPFIPSTSISFTLLSKSFVTLKVFDLVGREGATIMRQEKTAGTYHVAFDASKLPSGVYFYKLTTGEFTQVKKMLLIK
jgi:hypothetical protein